MLASVLRYFSYRIASEAIIKFIFNTFITQKNAINGGKAKGMSGEHNSKSITGTEEKMFPEIELNLMPNNVWFGDWEYRRCISTTGVPYKEPKAEPLLANNER